VPQFSDYYTGWTRCSGFKSALGQILKDFCSSCPA